MYYILHSLQVIHHMSIWHHSDFILIVWCEFYQILLCRISGIYFKFKLLKLQRQLQLLNCTWMRVPLSTVMRGYCFKQHIKIYGIYLTLVTTYFDYLIYVSLALSILTYELTCVFHKHKMCLQDSAEKQINVLINIISNEIEFYRPIQNGRLL